MITNKSFLKVIFLWGFYCLGGAYAYAIGLGNLSVNSVSGEPFSGSITILTKTGESQSLKELQVREADANSYVQLGIPKVSQNTLIEMTVEHNTQGVPIRIQMNSKDPLKDTNSVFNDIVVDLKWSSGSLQRVYTLLNPSAKEITTQKGNNLIELATKIQPNLSGASLEQTIAAIYRANPKAFIRGNINRLKADEKIIIPSSAMALSIPKEESRAIYVAGANDYVNKRLNNSTEENANKFTAPVVLKNEIKNPPPKTPTNAENLDADKVVKDRLKVGPSENDPNKAIKQAEVEQKLAQEKLMAEANQRVKELEKNVDDLKKLDRKASETKSESSNEANTKILPQVNTQDKVDIPPANILNPDALQDGLVSLKNDEPNNVSIVKAEEPVVPLITNTAEEMSKPSKWKSLLSQFGLPALFGLATGVFILAFVRRNRFNSQSDITTESLAVTAPVFSDNTPVKSAQPTELNTDESKISNTFTNPAISIDDSKVDHLETDEELDEEYEPVQLSDNPSQTAEVPQYARDIFQKVDLNLEKRPREDEPPSLYETLSAEHEMQLPGSLEETESSEKIPMLDPLPNAELSTIDPWSYEGQEIKINLARGYIKNQDFSSARALLKDVIDLGAQADPTLRDEAQEMLAGIGL